MTRGPRQDRGRRLLPLAAFALALLALVALVQADAGLDAGIDPLATDAGDLVPDAGSLEATLDAGAGDDARSPRLVDVVLGGAWLQLDAGIDAPVDAPIDAPVDAAVDAPPEPAPLDGGPSSRLIEEPELREPPTAATTTATTVFAIKVIGGLIILLALAYLGGHRRVIRFQEQLGISGVITAGFPFVALGLVARTDAVGILSDAVIDNIRPLMFFGLGWLGFIIGAQVDIRVLERVPKGTAYLVFVEALGPFLAVAAGCGAVMIAFGSSWRDLSVWRDAILLGAAAAMTAPRAFRGFANRGWQEDRSADLLLPQLDEIAGVIGLLFITAYFRDPAMTAWQLPSAAWIFVSLGIGLAVGALIFAMLRLPSSNAELLAVLVGGIAFASGFAGYLHLSPIVICFTAGVLVTNFPNEERENVFRILRHLERPLYLMFLIVAGAVWSVGDWRGWVLVPVFVATRVFGKWLGVLTSRQVVGQMPPAVVGQRTLVAPMSAMSIALVISVSHSYAGQTIAWVVTAVIGGAIATELLVPTERVDRPPTVPPGEAPTELELEVANDEEASS